MEKVDCFAYKNGKCKILTAKSCYKCKFYKPLGTECDTCHKKGTESCNHCRSKD